MASISLRSVARAFDPVEPPRRLGGCATDVDLDWYRARGNTADQTLHSAIRATGEGPIGLVQHPEKGLLQLHRWTPAERTADRHRSLRAAASRHGDGAARHRLLVWNTWLIDPPVVAGPPDRKARIGEIGEALDGSGCDIIALCEVFEENDGEAILDRISFPHESRRGPEAAGVEIGSGLQAIVRRPGRSIFSSHRMVFHNTAGMPDSLAQKGALHVEVDVGPGRIDLFVTHMDAESPDDDGFLLAREHQTAELGRFIEAHRKAENVTVVVGDFNIDGRDAGYARLLRMMYERSRGRIPIQPGPSVFASATSSVGAHIEYDIELRLQDLWLSRGSRLGATASVDDFDAICRLDDNGYCDDLETAGEPSTKTDRMPGYRLDYVFVEEPRDEHAFHLDLSRVRRRPFWRGGDHDPDTFSHVRPATPEELALRPTQRAYTIPHYLSDHLGLEVILMASRKRS